MTDRHVVPATDGWHVEKEHAKRPSARTATRAEAITRASQIVANEGGGHVVIHARDGKESETRTVTTDTDTPSASATNGAESQTRGRHAAHRAAHRNSLHLDLPLVGSVALPPPDQLAYLGGVTTLVAIGILEWPIAALLGAGHLLASTRNNKILADFGEALEEA